MTRANPESLLFKITQIETIIRLIKDDFLRDHLIPDLKTVNLVISEMESLRDFVYSQKTSCTNKIRTVNQTLGL